MSIIVGGTLIGGEHLEAKLQAAFETWSRFEVNDYFRDQFNNKPWDYPSVTFRKSGQTVGPEPRDIYDLGNLYRSGRDSFSITMGVDDVTASWNWNATNSSGGAYAWYVHEGLSTNIKARRWTDELQNPALFDASTLKKALQRRIKTAMGK